MTGYVYILQCNDGSYYTGSTKNMEARLWQHQNGQGANHTRKRLPVKLVFVEQFDRIEDAFAREKQIQGWSRKKKEALMQGDFNELHRLAECRNHTHHSGFDSAQPTASGDFVDLDSATFDPATFDSAQVTETETGTRTATTKTRRVSEVEPKAGSPNESKSKADSPNENKSKAGSPNENESKAGSPNENKSKAGSLSEVEGGGSNKPNSTQNKS